LQQGTKKRQDRLKEISTISRPIHREAPTMAMTMRVQVKDFKDSSRPATVRIGPALGLGINMCL
jgi:hypothetical protein